MATLFQGGTKYDEIKSYRCRFRQGILQLIERFFLRRRADRAACSHRQRRRRDRKDSTLSAGRSDLRPDSSRYRRIRTDGAHTQADHSQKAQNHYRFSPFGRKLYLEGFGCGRGIFYGKARGYSDFTRTDPGLFQQPPAKRTSVRLFRTPQRSG